MRSSSLILLVLCLAGTSYGQGERWWNEQHYFGKQSPDKSSIWGGMDYRLMSNRITNEVMNAAIWNGKVESSTTEYLIDEPSDSKTTLQAGLQGSLWYRHAMEGDWNLNVGFGIEDAVYGRMETGLAQLYLKGNGPFEDETLPLGPSWLNYMSFQFVGAGVDRTSEQLSIGATIQLIKVSRYEKLRIEESSLYTAPFGEYLEANLDMQWHSAASAQSKASAWYGTGASLNAYITHRSSSGKGVLSAEMRNLGFAHFGGLTQYSYSRDTIISGVEVDNILSLGDELSGESNIDSIESIIGLESASKSHTALMPGSLQVSFVQSFGEKSSIAIQARQYFMSAVPEVRVGYAWRLSPAFGVEPYFRAGGFTRIDYGLSIFSNPMESVQLILRYELLESQITGSSSTSQALTFGGQVLF